MTRSTRDKWLGHAAETPPADPRDTPEEIAKDARTVGPMDDIRLFDPHPWQSPPLGTQFVQRGAAVVSDFDHMGHGCTPASWG